MDKYFENNKYKDYETKKLSGELIDIATIVINNEASSTFYPDDDNRITRIEAYFVMIGMLEAKINQADDVIVEKAYERAKSRWVEKCERNLTLDDILESLFKNQNL